MTDQQFAMTVRFPPRVLVADDDPEMRRLLVAALGKDGSIVTDARDGDDLLRKLASSGAVDVLEEPDVIVSDLRMPGTNGLEAVAAIRRAGWRMPIIVITAFGDAATHARARELGVAATLDKPFDVDDLRVLVLTLIHEVR